MALPKPPPINQPYRSDLEAFLWKVHAAECFEQDALDILAKAEGTKIDKVVEVLRVVESELNGAEMNIEGENSREDLRSLRDTCRRAAILLLHAAWFADHTTPRQKPGSSGAADQPDLFEASQ